MEIIDWTSASYDEARSTLRKWREDHSRRSEEVVEIWEHVLSRYISSLKDELWVVLEQVTLAALDCARQDLAIDCIQCLNNQFPRSSRVTKLQAMRLESLGRYDDAVYLYDKLLQGDEANSLYRKRKIAILLAKGERVEAIKALNEYLVTFINDTEAWLQLGELFAQDGDYSRAIFCFEELLLANPQNAAYLCRVAELRYTLGGLENVEIAKAYYERAAKLSSSASALYGIVLCSNQLMGKATAPKKKELIASGLWASDELQKLYTGQGSNEENGTNPTVDQQLRVVQLLRAQFKQ